jgi:hypothetical protein
MRSQRFLHEFVLIFLLVVTIGIIAFQSNLHFTGFVVGPSGEQCDGTWTCGDWGTCTDSNQTRECTSNDSLNCTSPISEVQSCVSENISCVENWTCSDWTNCTNLNQTRTCTDSASCGTTTNKPVEIQSCVSENTTVCTEDIAYSAWSSCSNGNKARTVTNTSSCGNITTTTTENQTCTVACTENWTCINWSTCSSGNQTRTCTDSASCGTTTNKPSIRQPCTSATTTSTTTTTTTTPVTAEVTQTCTPSPQCGDWQECIEGNQIRVCTDTNNCNPGEVASTESQACTVPIIETCSDKIKNQDETGIDCGGKCKKCGFFTIVGSAISGTVNSVLGNKTRALIFSGALFLVIAGFVCFRLFIKKKKKK